MDNSYHNSVASHDPDKLIYNFSKHVLNTTVKSLLTKGLNFVIHPKNINYAGFMLPFEPLCRDVDSLEVSNLDEEFIKSSLIGIAFLSYKDAGKNLEENFPKEDFDALKIPLKKGYYDIKSR